MVILFLGVLRLSMRLVRLLVRHIEIGYSIKNSCREKPWIGDTWTNKIALIFGVGADLRTPGRPSCR
jgi:hypothetical protein